MPRLPFDEREPNHGATPRSDRPLTVAELTGQLKRALGQAFPGKVQVVGEVSNFSGGRRGGGAGHWFFSLKDADATVRCVCFASVASRVPFEMQDGMEVVATGRVDLYPAQGSVQLYIDKLEPVGQGALELALQQLTEELRERGYFDEEHKQHLPAVPRRVAVVTSRGAAALQDVINTAYKRWPGCRLLLYDVRVQGDDAAPQIAEALRSLSEQGTGLGIDAIILTRGGGSIEDLWAFNERAVADAVFDCSLPVVAAIGHETDTTVAELVADLRCSTPTQAAMAVVPDRSALEHQIVQLQGRLTLLARRRAEHARHRLDIVARHPLLARPMRLVEDARQRIDQLDHRLRGLPARRLTDAQDRLDRLQRHLDAVGPQQVLKRGYAYALTPAGKPIRSADQVKPGDRVTTVVADGRFSSIVDGETDAHAKLSVRPAKRKPKPKGKPDTGGLFDAAS